MSLVVNDGYAYAPEGGGGLRRLLPALGAFRADALSACAAAAARQDAAHAARLLDLLDLGFPPEDG